MITEITEVMKRCYDKGWITTRDGNISVRHETGKCIYITPSGHRKNFLRVEDIIKMSVHGMELIIPKEAKPSGELHMHWLLQRTATTDRAVVHVHPTHVIAAMHAGFNLQEICKPFAEIYRYTKVAPTVPSLPATSEQLGLATYLSLCPTDDLKFDIVGQLGHGVCAVGTDPWNAYEHIERLDHICEIVLKSGIKP